MKKTKIGWCDSTWNPVTGCYHDCPYCYARGIAERFGTLHKPHTFLGGRPYIFSCGHELHELEEPAHLAETGKSAPYPFDFQPTLHEYKLGDYMAAKSRAIFVCSMGDLFGEWVPDEWIERVFKACKAAPQHDYIFLTKNPNRYLRLSLADKLPFDENMWYGTTATNPRDTYYWDGIRNTFLSIEPILEDFGEDSGEYQRHVDCVIIGAETGRRKGKVVPKREWIDKLVKSCDACYVPIFMKDSLIPIVGKENMRREFPWKEE